VLSDGIVQVAVMFSHREPVAPGDVVETHGDFDQHAIQGQKNVQHFVRIALAEDLIAQFAPFPFVLAGHGVHSAIRDSGSNAEREIETIDRPNWHRWISVTP
jgi:hypothetical protein